LGIWRPLELGSGHSPDDRDFPGWRASLQRKQPSDGASQFDTMLADSNLTLAGQA
jgi:hypothetical protein